MSITVKCNSCNIVINELLTFVQNKLDVMTEMDMCSLCVNSFSEEEIKQSKELLFQSIPTNKRRITRRKDRKQQKDMEDIIGLFKETDPELIPVFVARDLHKLPPFSFDHVDPTRLLKDNIILKTELNLVKERYATLEQLEDLKRRLDIIEKPKESQSSPLFTEKNLNLNVNSQTETYANKLHSSPTGLSHYQHSTNPSTSNECCSTTTTPLLAYDVELSERNTTAVMESVPSLSTVQRDLMKESDVKIDSPVRKSTLPTTAFDEKWTLVQRNKTKSRNRFAGNIGKDSTDSIGSFKAAESKIPIFITNVHKETNANDIKQYILQKTKENVTLQEINMKDKNKEHKAYKMYVTKNRLPMFLDENMWPMGIIFRRFVHFKQNENVDRPSSDNDTNKQS